MCKEVIVIGAGGHGKVVADIIEKSGDKFCGFLDDDISKNNVIDIVDNCYKHKEKYFIVAVGNNSIRKKIVEKYSYLNYYTAIHPTAVIGSDVVIKEGTVVLANAVVNSSTVIGKHCIINTASVVEHDNFVEDYVHVSPGAVLCGTVRVGKSTHIGANAVVKNNICIEKNVIIGCGSAVVKNIEKAGIYVGVPAEFMRNL